MGNTIFNDSASSAGRHANRRRSVCLPGYAMCVLLAYFCSRGFAKELSAHRHWWSHVDSPLAFSSASPDLLVSPLARMDRVPIGAGTTRSYFSVVCACESPVRYASRKDSLEVTPSLPRFSFNVTVLLLQSPVAHWQRGTCSTHSRIEHLFGTTDD